MNAPTTFPLEQPVRHRFTVADVDAMVAAGVLAPDAKTELLDGELIDMPSEGEAHLTFKVVLNTALVRAVSDDWGVVPDASLHLGPSDVPEPDFYVVPVGSRFVPVRTADVALVIEIADSSLRYDLGRKAAKYAEFGLAEYWVVDVRAQQTHVFCDPEAGAYRTARRVPFSETLTGGGPAAISLEMAALLARMWPDAGLPLPEPGQA